MCVAGEISVREVSVGDVSGWGNISRRSVHRGCARSGKCPSGKCPLEKCPSGMCPGIISHCKMALTHSSQGKLEIMETLVADVSCLIMNCSVIYIQCMLHFSY